MKRSLVALGLLFVACGLSAPACSEAGTTGESAATGGAPAPVRPETPPSNDAAFVVSPLPQYVLAGDGHTPATASFPLRVTPPAGVTKVDLWLDDGDVVPLTADGADFVVDVPTLDLDVGVHTLLLAERGAEVGFFTASFTKGHALYLVVSTDWDFPDVDDRVLDHHEELHTNHPELLITHLIGPYTFTDPAVSQSRRDLIVSWAKGMREAHGDEIGLHIHPRCTFVEAAGLTCLSEPSVAYPEGDPSGYTVRLGAYSEADWDVLFAKAGSLWDELGFGQPQAFRAGAWTLEAHVAKALANAGVRVDSSAVNWPYMEEWIGYDLYDWSEAQWGPIGDTSQPYYPTDDSVLPGGAGAPLDLLELPDNGIMVDYWTVDEMKGIFDANWAGQALTVPTQVSTGFHPAPKEYYSKAEYQRLDDFFAYADQFLASSGAGPVIYLRMTDAREIW